MNASGTSDRPAPAAAVVGQQREWRWTVALAVAALVLIALAFAHVWTWGLFDDFTFKPAFADTVAILASGEARHAGLDVYKENPIDPLGRPHVYGPWWLETGAMGLKVRDAAWIGPALAVAFVLAAAATLRPKRPLEAFFALALLCSPPVMLGIARGNNDLIVFLLFAAAAWLLTRRSDLVATAGSALLGLAAVLKLYPFAALPVILWRRKRSGLHHPDRDSPVARRSEISPWRWNSPRLFGFFAVVLACGLVLWIWRDDYEHALHLTPSPTTTLAYGWPVTILSADALAGRRWGFEIAWFIAFVVVTVLLGRRARHLWRTVPVEGFAACAFMVGGLAWILCFMAIRNYPYRMALLLLPAGVWLDRSARRDDTDTGRLQIIFWTLAAWIDVPKRMWAPIAARDPTVTGPAWTAFETIIGIEQGIIAALTLCLAFSIGGAFVRVFREK